MTSVFEATFIWCDGPWSSFRDPERRMCRTVSLGETAGGFGLLEPDRAGWSLCIPAGAEVEAAVGERSIDLSRLRLEPSGERRLPLEAGLSAAVRMGEYRFEVRPAA